jgi:predicted dienelactone hydrolase
MKRIFPAVIAVLWASAVHAHSVGFQTVMVPDLGNPPIFVGIWYPSDAPEKPEHIALDTVSVAHDGAIAGQDLKLIMMSHGTGGGFADQVDTATALASAGFVAAAPTHTGDNWKDRSRVLSIWERPRQLHVVANWLLSTWPAHTRLDQAHIGVFGYSAGGFTALVEAGGNPDLSLLDKHCITYPKEFTCALITQFQPKGGPLPAAPPGAWVHDPRISATVLVAPALGFTFGKSGLSGVRMPVQLWRGGSDTTLPQPFHAQAINDNLPVKPDYHVVPGAQHLDFMSPCDAIKAKTVPGICTSLPGFNRAVFHASFNESVVAFFKSHL